jgi:uncharacterized protein YciI
MACPRRRKALAAARIAFLALLALLPGSLPAVDNEAKPQAASPAPREQFIIRLKPAQPGKEISDEEKEKIARHFDYLKGLLSEGTLLLAGMATDDYEGIMVIQARNRLDAERIMASDPAVGGNVFLADLHPFRVSLRAGGE